MTSPSLRVTLVRAAAIYLAVASALVLSGLVDIDGPWRFLSLYLRAFLVTAVFQIGLFWAPTARGRQRLLAALLMVPGALMYASLIGEAILRVARGFPLRPLATTTWLIAAFAYASQFLFLARRRTNGS